jgi:hypothetical protein
MPDPFFVRLRDYYVAQAHTMQSEARKAGIYANNSDRGYKRETIFKNFLKEHAPAKCNTFLGGFLYGENGSESPQIDIIVTTDTTPRFSLEETSFSPVEGTLGVVSVKSILNKDELEDALQGIARIPPTEPLGNRAHPGLPVHDYDDWPYKLIFSYDGIAPDTIGKHINAFYQKNPSIPLHRRPNMLHVLGKYFIIRGGSGATINSSLQPEQKTTIPSGEYKAFTDHPDLQAISWTLNELQRRAMLATHILFDHASVMNKVNASAYWPN